MSEFAPKPSLAALPPELMGFIIPPSINLDVPLIDSADSKRLADFRSLSHTCRRLREFTLHLVWARVEIKTVKQLGELQEMLKEAPDIARLIRSFRFLWHMDGDGLESVMWPYEQGTALELAFCDRLELWDKLMKKMGADAEYDEYDGVIIRGRCCLPPGRRPDWQAVGEQGTAAYDWLSEGERGKGPDGNGEDALIKSAQQFTECITEVVSKLALLVTFGWETPVTPMPRGVFDALARLTTLKDLHVQFSTYRDNLSDLPLWELTGNLKTLSFCGMERDQRVEELPHHAEAAGSILAVMSDRAARARNLVHLSIASRAIIAAARGDQLGRRDPGYHGPVSQFKVRELMPYWILIEDWGKFRHETSGWIGTAVTLRPFFAHVSQHVEWLGPSSNASAQSARLVTLQDLRALQVYFRDQQPSKPWYYGGYYEAVVQNYLPWLIEDAQLGQRVLDTWTSIVERGDANKVGCMCREYGYR